MRVVSQTATFKASAHEALSDERLQAALRHVESSFVNARAQSIARAPEFDLLRDAARDIKDHTLAHLDLYLEVFEEKVCAAGGAVHFARTADEARESILSICQSKGAKKIAKGKSMVSEEIDLNAALEHVGMQVVETDLGEYILQLRREKPSHIIAPAVHLSRHDVEAEFRRAHEGLPQDRNFLNPADLVEEARCVLRHEFLEADVGLTGANFLVAETGSVVLVTNEGNGDLCQSLPRTLIVLASIEKLVPSLEDASVMLRVLARSATGQDTTAYTTISTGPRRSRDPDGPEEFHVVVIDNGRSALLGSSFHAMLRCIRCGACMNHCPIYQSVGGHAYGGVYPGPMGAVLTPALAGLEENAQLPNASTFCGRCEEVCPVRIPLPHLMRHWREREFERRLTPAATRQSLAVWAYFARRPLLYRLTTSLAMRCLAMASRRRGRFTSLPFASPWTRSRDFPAPQGVTFQALWRARGRNHELRAR